MNDKKAKKRRYERKDVCEMTYKPNIIKCNFCGDDENEGEACCGVLRGTLTLWQEFIKWEKTWNWLAIEAITKIVFSIIVVIVVIILWFYVR